MSEDIRAKLEARADEGGNENCALCTGALDADKSKRGMVEFMDGWFWICNQCKNEVGLDFDYTQYSTVDELSDNCTVIPYMKRGRKSALKWLKKEFGITIEAD